MVMEYKEFFFELRPNRREINEALLAAGQKPISEEYFWCRRQHAIKQSSNYIVRMYNGYIDQCSRDYYSATRAIIPIAEK